MADHLNPDALDQQALEAAAKALVAVQQPEVQGEYAWRVQDAAARTELLDEASAAVSAYLANLPRTLRDIGAFLALPNNTAVQDKQGDVGVILNGWIWYPETARQNLVYAFKHYGPFIVLQAPTEGGDQ